MSDIDPVASSESTSGLSSVYSSSGHPVSHVLENFDSAPSTLDTCTPAASSSSLPSMTSRSILAPSIKFAPLPEIGPRKRRSNQPLGVAARSQLMRRRRGGLHGQKGRLVSMSDPIWTREDMEEQRLRAEVLAARQASANAQEVIHQISEDDDDVDEEMTTESRTHENVDDPFLVLSKILKGARKSIWRNISKAEDDERQKHKREHHMKERMLDIGPRPILLRSASPPPGPITPNPWNERQLERNHQGTPLEDYDGVARQSDLGSNEALVIPSSPIEPPPRPTSPSLPDIFSRVSISSSS